MRSRGALTIGFGLAYLVLGAVLFLHELDVLTLRWAYLGPVILVLFGVALIVGGLLAERLRRVSAAREWTAGEWTAGEEGVPGPDGWDPTVLTRDAGGATPITPPGTAPGPDADRQG